MTAISTAPTPPAAGTFSAADEAFFRITAALFPPAFVFGAGVLLGTYDDEVDEWVPAPRRTARHAAGAVTVPTPVSA